ncbi:hypothetical protein [Thalassotalea montiporae]
MPQTIGGFDFGLEDLETNRDTYCEVIKKQGYRELFTHKGLPVVKVRGSIAQLDHKNKAVYFCLHLGNHNSYLVDRTLTQCILWRSCATYTKDLAARVFNDYLLKHYTLQAGYLQTKGDYRFWQLRLQEALSKGFYVYCLDYHKVKVTIIETSEQLDDLFPWMKGKALKHKYRRYAVSDTPISLRNSVHKKTSLTPS